MPQPNTLSLTTNEVGPGTEVPYKDYWQHYSTAVTLVDPGDVAKTRSLKSYVSRLAEHAIRGANPYMVELMPDMRTREPQEHTLPLAIKEWYQSVGVYAHFDEEGQDDLLLAANILLYGNFGSKPRDFGMLNPDSSSIYDQFAGQLAHIAVIQGQRPRPELLLAAQMIHDAGWSSRDPVRRTYLFARAEQMYERIYNEDKALWADRLTAGQYLADIHFYRLGQEIQVAVKANDSERVVVLQDKAMDHLATSVKELRQARRCASHATRTGKPNGGLEADQWGGKMLERLSDIALRHLIYVQSVPETTGIYAVRSAFLREDEGRTLMLRPKPFFDRVVQRWDAKGGVERSTPIQLKLDNTENGEGPKGGTSSDYLSMYVCVRNLPVHKMVKAADDMLVAYAEKRLERYQGPLGRVQRLLSIALEAA